MTFQKFLEAIYTSSNRLLQEDYSVEMHAKTQAIKTLVDIQRAVYRWLSYFQILAEFTLIKAGIKSQPKSALEIIQAQMSSTEQADGISNPGE